MKSALISIKPKYCELIANGKKTIEVRKTRPKDTPFKCYIYCTKDKKHFFWSGKKYSYVDDHSHNMFDKSLNGKIIGEFVCDKTNTIHTYSDLKFSKDCTLSSYVETILKYGCLSLDELIEYANNKEYIYGWHISNLKIYDEPKELSEFNKPCDFNYDCFLCDRAVYDKKVITDISGKITKVNNKFIACDDVITRPPQSWCYVEELRE